jgi:PTS system nitrogen regulatory IIA component
MELTVKDVVKLLIIPQPELNKLVQKKEIPFQKIRDVLYFNKQQVVDWALGRNMPINISNHTKMSDYHIESLKPLLSADSFYYSCDLTEADYIEKMTKLIKLEKTVDTDIIAQLLKSREELMSTAIGNGISIPHPRVPLMLGSDKPLINFFFPVKPLQLKSLDGKPVHTIILLISQTIKQHLSLLAHISFLLSKKEFQQALEKRLPYGQITDLIGTIENGRNV